MTARKIGVVVCQCGGNISDYVDVEKVKAEVGKEAEVVSAQVQMFACSDAAQQAVIQEIREKKLDGIVVCSCSPKLHTATFRAMAERAGLNPYEYTQVNIREQCSWAHTHDRALATGKALELVRAGVAKTALSQPLERIRVETLPQALVVGAGVAGLRAALALSDLGISVHLVEKSARPGGQVARWGDLFPNGKVGQELVDGLVAEVARRDNIVTYLNSELVEKEGRIGDFAVKLRTGTGDTVPLRVGAIVIATGFEPYSPGPGEFGFGLPGVITLPELKELLATRPGRLVHRGQEVRTIAYIYCVGSREETKEGSPHTYCSRYCCSATSHIATVVGQLDPSIHQFHLFRDIRTYGKYEALYERALRSGSVFLRYGEEEPPTVRSDGGQLVVKVKDRLMAGEEVELHPDLVVLVTGMVPRDNSTLTQVLKLPVGLDGFFREVHVKLRPVETVVDGVFIVGAAQGPKNVAESVMTALAAVSKAGALLLKGYVDLDPLVARVDPTLCVWCDACLKACPYGAIDSVDYGEKKVAEVNPVLCKGEGGCVPACPKQAVSVLGYTNEQITSMIDAMAKEAA
ncbi:MAG TPA: CoB--CoM heterodisulfide reductase iron-sulfur subunit A family protein [Thermoplasmata archaeon]|nr:CoB--CoM heterodisulfide reductase iron-sulfur subunit A family protein [Thermoplasmata archaeon]